MACFFFFLFYIKTHVGSARTTRTLATTKVAEVKVLCLLLLILYVVLLMFFSKKKKVALANVFTSIRVADG